MVGSKSIQSWSCRLKVSDISPTIKMIYCLWDDSTTCPVCRISLCGINLEVGVFGILQKHLKHCAQICVRISLSVSQSYMRQTENNIWPRFSFSFIRPTILNTHFPICRTYLALTSKHHLHLIIMEVFIHVHCIPHFKPCKISILQCEIRTYLSK